ncbi:ATP-dependent helicase [Mucilaginibacter sp. JRF]|uniref:UvrD-helicase domain-containing protein n=1 Tax=Mucilaginibacter sp. JRF TaxID=2780088 RepID=UPI00187EE1B8|nr:ATP-dependent helicase [Mucilaginibacter sp. JRF]MBE9585710.1 ATP-dependent helicase [Mucilaginibacter sp. JRF]
MAVNKDVWIPADGFELEANALAVIKSEINSLVLAGPGAGKTELLAQKASYLLQTNQCKFPTRILAISFKRDAAFNLKERVKMRCGDELSKRFDSITFDSFAKQILDRFRLALPNDYSISGDYEIAMKDNETLNYYQTIDPDTNYEVRGAAAPVALKNHTGDKLPLDKRGASKKIRHEVWQQMLNATPSQLNFKMIMRLAELIVAKNPKIKSYLQETYPYVFLDEFQDATGLQYDFFKTCFLDSDSQYTAVGDDKQRIMLWAGALDAVFDDFMSDTEAARVPLQMNFRCAPRLVSLLNHLTEHLLGKTDFAIPSPKWKGGEGDCFFWIFDNPTAETAALFTEVKKWIEEDGLRPRDICILVKQKLENYAGGLIRFFNENGIKARDENAYQDLLTQDITIYIIHTLYTIYKKKSSESKSLAFGFLSNVFTEFEDEQLMRLEAIFYRFIKNCQKDYKSEKLDVAQLKVLVESIVEFAGYDRIRAFYPAYKNLKYFKGLVAELVEKLGESFEVTKNILSALDQLIGNDTIPVMTVHKSKGLEYHTVIFIGLEDGAFWKFQENPDEDKCTFFVALSRAKERVIFTFSKERPNQYGRMFVQSIDNIQVILDELENSGIVTIEEKN